jgi:hypothetical protein
MTASLHSVLSILLIQLARKLIKFPIHIRGNISNIFREPANIQLSITAFNLGFQLGVSRYLTIGTLVTGGIVTGFSGNIGTMPALIIPLYLYFIVEFFSGSGSAA